MIPSMETVMQIGPSSQYLKLKRIKKIPFVMTDAIVCFDSDKTICYH